MNRKQFMEGGVGGVVFFPSFFLSSSLHSSCIQKRPNNQVESITTDSGQTVECHFAKVEWSSPATLATNRSK